MRKQILKSALLAMAGVGLLAGGALAAPLATWTWADYEYYQYPADGTFVVEPNSYTFSFDLTNLGGDSTTSLLTFQNDVSGYGPSLIPVDQIWAAVSIYSIDTEIDRYNIQVLANYNDVTYNLGNSILDINQYNSYWTSIFSFNSTLLDDWRENPSGDIILTVTNNTQGDDSDFNLREVGVGVTPVPEPATMLLFGTGLAGLAAVARRRKTQA